MWLRVAEAISRRVGEIRAREAASRRIGPSPETVNCLVCGRRRGRARACRSQGRKRPRYLDPRRASLVRRHARALVVSIVV